MLLIAVAFGFSTQEIPILVPYLAMYVCACFILTTCLNPNIFHEI